MSPMPGVVHVFKDCTFEGTQINVQVTNNNNNNNSTTNNNYGQQQSDSSYNKPEGERQEYDGGTQDPPHQESQAPNASANFQQQSQQQVSNRSDHDEDTAVDPSLFPPSRHSTSSLNGNSTPSSMPGLVTPGSSCLSSEAESSISHYPVTSESEPATSESELVSSDSGITSPKQLVTEEEVGVHLGDSTGNVPGEEDGDGEEEEDEGEAAATAGDDKWEESKEKEGDGNPRELGDVRLSVEETDHEGASSISMPRPAAGRLLDMGSGLTSAQQPGDQPMSLRSTPSVMHRPVTINNTSSAEQVQEEEPQAQLTAHLLGDLARSDARDMYTAAQDEMDPDMIARLVRLRADEDITENRMSSEPEEDTVVNPTEQVTGPSNGEACPPQPPGPRISLHVSPPEPVEGDRVDFELLNVPLHGIGDVVWNHNGRPLHHAAGLHHTIHSVSQNDAGIYQCIIYGRTNIVAVVEVTLNVKKSTDVAGQPYMEEEGGSGGGTGNDQQHAAGRSGDTSRQTDAPLPGSGNTPGQHTQGGRDHTAETSVLGATTVNPDYESLQQRYELRQKLMKLREDLSYYPNPFLRSPDLPADLLDCVVMNAGETTTTPFDPMLEKLTAVVVAPDAPATPKKKSPPNRTALLALSIERKDSAPFIKDGSNGQSITGGEIGAADHEMDRPTASGSCDRSGEEPSGSGSSRQPGQGQKDAQCPDRSPAKPRKVAVPAQPDIDPIYYGIPLSELMDDADLLDEIKYKLDQDSCGRKNWENLGAKFGIPRDQLKHFAYNRKHTEAVLERVSSQSPDTSVGDLMNKLYQMKRGDVVDVIKENMCT